ncbi:RP-L4 [Lepeophtheirus salmonis]|uniref:Large ribosomal subunit protein uL4m n=1 Tax=Lepeophtheirus salmonis TaxID=72036 RepID=A0A7R8D4P4_LEPSM|nr:RP-L4 [Lepeophtheirus salmonis]CAF3023677.1 RP-L4 [Lepeophtheirus salmonis]
MNSLVKVQGHGLKKELEEQDTRVNDLLFGYKEGKHMDQKDQKLFFFFMLPYQHRVNGLIHTLSVKFAQDDIIIVQNFDDLESTDPEDLEDLISERGWGLSTLFVNGDSIAPENITAASESILHVNVMPSFGLNVHSMLKHKTLVLTLDAVNLIEDKLLFAQRRSDAYSISLKKKIKNQQACYK